MQRGEYFQGLVLAAHTRGCMRDAPFASRTSSSRRNIVFGCSSLIAAILGYGRHFRSKCKALHAEERGTLLTGTSTRSGRIWASMQCSAVPTRSDALLDKTQRVFFASIRYGASMYGLVVRAQQY